MRTSALIVSFAAGVVLVGCQSSDVGRKCTLTGPFFADNPATGAVYFEESTSNGCDDLVCIQSSSSDLVKLKMGNNPYCSKPCSATDDCEPDDTGLVCRFITADLSQVPEAQRAQFEELLGNTRLYKYCATPL